MILATVPNLAQSAAFPISVSSNSILLLPQSKNFDVISTPLLHIPVIKPSENPIGSTFKMYPESNFPSLSLNQATIISSLQKCKNRPALLKICNLHSVALRMKIKLLNLAPSYLSSCISHQALDCAHQPHQPPFTTSYFPMQNVCILNSLGLNISSFFSSLV